MSDEEIDKMVGETLSMSICRVFVWFVPMRVPFTVEYLLMNYICAMTRPCMFVHLLLLLKITEADLDGDGRVDYVEFMK